MSSSGTHKKPASLAVKLANRERASVATHTGALTLFIEDKPCSALVVDTPNFAQEQFEKCIELASTSDLNVIRVSTEGLFWSGPDELDTRSVDLMMAKLTNCPNSIRFIISLRVDAPQWWLQENQSERVAYCTPEGGSKSSSRGVSWASQRYLRDAGSALERLLKYILNSTAGSRLIGIQIATDQGAFKYPDPERFPDVSPCMTTAFVADLSEKYRRNTGLLRKAWFDTRADFTKVRCPSAEERLKADFGIFRNPHRSKRLFDYFESISGCLTNAALHFCSIVKRVSHRTIIVGLTSAPMDIDSQYAESGHSFPERLLSSEDVDYFVEDNTSSATNDVFLPYRDSCTLHGKLVLSAADNLETIYLSAARGFGGIISINTPIQVNKLSELNRYLLKQRPKPTRSQFAVILDPAVGTVVTKRKDAAQVDSLVLNQLDIIEGSGLPITYLSISDLFHGKYPDQKVVLLPNCYYLSDSERRKLDARIKRSEQTAGFFWAPGIVSEDGINAENGEKCCGQKVRVEAGSVSLKTRVALSTDALTWGRHSGEFVGSEQPITPIVTITDKHTLRLGANSDNKTVFAVRRFETWSSVVFGTLTVPLDLITNLLKGAGCHIYCSSLKSGDKLSCDGRSIAIRSERGGTYLLSLPGVHDVSNVITGEKIIVGESEFKVQLSPGEGAIFELRPKKSGQV